MGELKTEAIVLRRTDYGETDRIIDILTPSGKYGVMAKGVRKERSRLAGGIELFCLTNLTLHFKEGRGDSLAVLTSAKLVRAYRKILADYEVLEFASRAMREVSKMAEATASEEYFSLLKQVLEGLDEGIELPLVKVWFFVNLKRIMGEELNLYYDLSGERLSSKKRYNWDEYERAMVEAENGEIGAGEITFLRLAATHPLKFMLRVKGRGGLVERVEKVAS